MNRRTELTYTDYENDQEVLSVKLDVTDLNTSDYIEKIVDLMKLQGYHPVPIRRALLAEAEDIVEYFESIESAKEEWGDEG